MGWKEKKIWSTRQGQIFFFISFLYVFTPCVNLFWLIPKEGHFWGLDQNEKVHSGMPEKWIASKLRKYISSCHNDCLEKTLKKGKKMFTNIRVELCKIEGFSGNFINKILGVLRNADIVILDFVCPHKFVICTIYIIHKYCM